MKRPVNVEQAERALEEFLAALGYDRQHVELAGTPGRVVEAYLSDLIVGERVDVEELIAQGAVPSNSQSLVVVRDIVTMTMCPHHLLPAEGHATVAYLPGAKMLGLGTMAQLVDAYSRRLTLQEQIGDAVVQALMHIAGARGAYCALRFQHACLRLRGARQHSAVVESVHVAGLLSDAPYAGQLVLALGATPSTAATAP